MNTIKYLIYLYKIVQIHQNCSVSVHPIPIKHPGAEKPTPPPNSGEPSAKRAQQRATHAPVRVAPREEDRVLQEVGEHGREDIPRRDAVQSSVGAKLRRLRGG